jgi:hypothetical protein
MQVWYVPGTEDETIFFVNSCQTGKNERAISRLKLSEFWTQDLDYR